MRIGEVVILCTEIRETLVDLTVENRWAHSSRFAKRPNFFLFFLRHPSLTFFRNCSITKYFKTYFKTKVDSELPATSPLPALQPWRGTLCSWWGEAPSSTKGRAWLRHWGCSGMVWHSLCGICACGTLHVGTIHHVQLVTFLKLVSWV